MATAQDQKTHSEAPDLFEVFAVRFAGPVTTPGSMVMWFKDWDRVLTRSYFLFVARSPDHTVLFDCGVRPRLAGDRGLSPYQDPAVLLEGLGVTADEVRHVVLSHLHWDHAGGIELFPKARFYVQRLEYEFWLENPVAQAAPFASLVDPVNLAHLEVASQEGRLKLMDGERELFPGLTCLPAPGHTLGLQALAVNTKEGLAILGSDCGHTFRNFQESWPSCLITDMVAWVKSLADLKGRVRDINLIFPGHDDLMATRFPEAAPEVFKLA